MERWTYILKSMYRKEPVISFVITAGAVEAAIGGLSEHWSLLSIGLGSIGVAIALRLRQKQVRRPTEMPNRSPVYVLSPSDSNNLPMLSIPKKNSPR